MKNRILAVTMIFVLSFCLLLTGCKGKSDKGDKDAQIKADTFIKVSSAEGSVGDTVKVPVKISGNPGIMALLIDFGFDNETLKYVGYEKGDVFSDYDISEDGGNLRLMILENEDVKGDGTLLTLEFEILNDDNKETEIKAIIESNSICNYDEELILTEGKNGKIKIK